MAFTVPYDTGYLDHASTHTEQFGIASTLYKLFFGEEPEFEITGRPLKPDGFPEVKHALYGPIIRKCWLGYYSSIAELEAEVSKLDDGVEPPSRSLGIARLSGIPGGRYFSGFLGRLSHFLGTIWTVADKLGVSRLLPPLRRTPCETQSAKPAVLDEETLARLRKVCEDLQEEYKEDTAEFVSRDPEWE
ncbi:MAG: hypothetical protein M4579_004297 [Chaenotheca gracillima]|nr:MAG: hypothetical protein M4579_004297 [Chaenotheca gracillima]